MDDFQQFLNKLQKRGSKPYKLSHCFGARDAWKWVRKNKWKLLGGVPCDKCLYGKIIDTVHQCMVEMLLEGRIVEFPHQMGSILLASLPAKVYHDGTDWQTTYRTDWKKTLDLWYRDEEARNTHKPIKRIARNIVFIRYQKCNANYHNKRFYSYRANRSLVRKLGAALEAGSVNAARLKEYY